VTIQDLKDNKLILLEAISGSRSYGLDLPHSDTDIKGVYFLPVNQFYSLNYPEQINNATNDEVYYELGKFIELLLKNNPNILELLSSPEECILYKHPIMNKLSESIFLSKLCKQTFAGYAMSQIKKAKGLNKKIVNPIDKERKSILDFCYVVHKQGSIPLKQWMYQHSFHQDACGLVNISHMKDMYALYHNSQVDNTRLFNGIIYNENSNEVSLSSVPENIQPLAIMSVNKDGYSRYCKDYQEYWNWVKARNDERYQNTLDNGKNFDAKNMMHVFRLLNMAEEIAIENKINVKRQERDFLLRIRKGEYEYDDLVLKANEKIEKINKLFDNSDLQEAPDVNQINQLLVEMRIELYS
jgi:hypothetical protein